MAGALGSIVVVGVVVLWGFYGFRYNARPSPLVLSPTLAEYVGPLAGVEAHGILLAAKLHALPESWLYGLTDVRAMANGMPSYFFGRVYLHGVWFYFPVLFIIKTTLAMLALLALTLFAVLRGWLRADRELWFLAAPPALYVIVAMSSHLNIGCTAHPARLGLLLRARRRRRGHLGAAWQGVALDDLHPAGTACRNYALRRAQLHGLRQ